MAKPVKPLVSSPCEAVMNLEDILNDMADPQVRVLFSLYLRQEFKIAEEKAVLRLAQKFRHLLPDSQQALVTEAMRNMPTSVTLAM